MLAATTTGIKATSGFTNAMKAKKVIRPFEAPYRARFVAPATGASIEAREEK
jgi:hypothetical protein